MLGAEEKALLVQGLRGKILMLEALSVVCHPGKTDGGRVRSYLVLFYLLSATCMHTHRHTDTDTHRDTHIDTHRERHRHTQTLIQTHTHTHTQTHRDTHRDTHRERHRHTQTHI